MSFHSHAHFELYYFHGGKGHYLIGDKIFVLSPGDLILMHGMTLHCPNMDASVPYRRTTVHFDPAFVKALADDKPFEVNVLKPFYELKNCRIPLSGDVRLEVEALLEKMRKLSDDRGKVSRDRMLVAFLDLLLIVYDVCEQSADSASAFPTDKERHVQSVVDYLEEHYQEDVHLEHLEERLHVNKYYLSKLFKEVTGATIFNYLYHRRINQAKIHFLLERSLSVTDVCYKVGFKHPSHFTRMFKQRVGVTPEQYKRQAARS
ncbi:AraC family transcriptional regulator [Paenibacillus flagellatus]|uniref:AraC family transcriptional regulator n=2 Tax=Paenibacillus flagellatus TaxID=2211139 RepID=A0A2V5JZB4_9BACL|nr:AraC family transcriptional regulator [Paenibacillus flagellatus]